MSTVFRPARESDLEQSDELVCRSINELTEKHGFGPFATRSAPNFQAFSLHDDADGLWVAENAGRMLGFAFSWETDGLWFLAQLFVSPDHQGEGIGAELLKRTLAHAESRACRHKALITFAFNRVSQGLYMRHGLFPTAPIYFFAGDRRDLRPHASHPGLRSVPLQGDASRFLELARIDGRALGVGRDKHHRYLTTDTNSDGFFLFAGSRCVGYTYVSKTGHIGPLAVIEDDLLAGAFGTALGLALDAGAPQVSAFLPGSARSAMALAVEHRMRVTLPMVMMAGDDFGQWTRYLPRNPGFM